MRVAIIILARGGSKRIPKKNIVSFKNKPLICWTITDAIALGCPIYVFTDMPEIRDICKNYPVKVREKLFENENGIHETGKELVEYNKEIGAEHLILLQATSPVRDVALMDDWIMRYLNGNYDAGFAAHKLKPAFYYDESATSLNFFDGDRNYNSNVKGAIYRETGSFYIFRASQAEKNHILNTNNRIIFDDPYQNDIDNLADLVEATE